MSQENVERARHIYERVRTGGDVSELLDDDVPWHPPEDVPEHASLAGREAILQDVSGYVDAFDDFDVEAEGGHGKWGFGGLRALERTHQRLRCTGRAHWRSGLYLQ